MFLSQDEIALAMQMTGNTPEDLLVQEHLQEARTTQQFLEQVSSCRELINILDWKFPQYEKSSSATYKLLCSILHNPTKFKGENPIAEGEFETVKFRLIAIQNSIQRLRYTRGKKKRNPLKTFGKKKPMANKRGRKNRRNYLNNIDSVIEDVIMASLN